MHKVIAGLFCALLVAGGVTAGVQAGKTAAATYDVPAAQQDRIGLYHWSSNTTPKPAGVDRLTWGTNAAANLGTRTVRVALTAADSYLVNNGATTLAAIADQAAYRTLFADPRLTTYFLTVYSATDLQGTWSDGYTAAEQRVTHDETAALATELLQTYQHKKFVFLNWEGDNALQAFPSSNEVAWSGYTDWVKARVSGVADARQAVSSTSQVYSGLEFNAVRRSDTGAACNATTSKCVISYVAPKVEADYYSYSAWQSLDPSTISTDAISTRLSADLTTAYGDVAVARPSVTHADFVLGEFGTARDVTGECEAATRDRKAIETLESWGASYGISWQTMDNDPAAGELFLGYGSYKRDGSLALSGGALRNLYTTGTATVPSAGCATINQGGVVQGRTFTPVIHRGDVISIFGANFSSTGNVIWIKQQGKFTAIKAGSPWWFESPTQLNATLPAAVVVGDKVTVYVTRADGRDSNAQVINVLS